jgi:hypothetical protein
LLQPSSERRTFSAAGPSVIAATASLRIPASTIIDVAARLNEVFDLGSRDALAHQDVIIRQHHTLSGSVWERVADHRETCLPR